MFSFESQITLVNSASTTKLPLTKPRSVLNTHLLLDGRPYITISTVDPAYSVTKITDLQTGELLVTIKKRRSFFADIIEFAHRYEGKSFKIRDWLRESTTPDGSVGWAVQTAAGNFIWRKHPTLRLALYPDNDSLDHPIAWLQLETATEPCSIILERGTESYRDEIIAGVVILEQRMRLEEKQYFRAEGNGQYELGSAGHPYIG